MHKKLIHDKFLKNLVADNIKFNFVLEKCINLFLYSSSFQVTIGSYPCLVRWKQKRLRPQMEIPNMLMYFFLLQKTLETGFARHKTLSLSIAACAAIGEDVSCHVQYRLLGFAPQKKQGWECINLKSYSTENNGKERCTVVEEWN